MTGWSIFDIFDPLFFHRVNLSYSLKESTLGMVFDRLIRLMRRETISNKLSLYYMNIVWLPSSLGLI